MCKNCYIYVVSPPRRIWQLYIIELITLNINYHPTLPNSETLLSRTSGIYSLTDPLNIRNSPFLITDLTFYQGIALPVQIKLLFCAQNGFFIPQNLSWLSPSQTMNRCVEKCSAIKPDIFLQHTKLSTSNCCYLIQNNFVRLKQSIRTPPPPSKINIYIWMAR